MENEATKTFVWNPQNTAAIAMAIRICQAAAEGIEPLKALFLKIQSAGPGALAGAFVELGRMQGVAADVMAALETAEAIFLTSFAPDEAAA
jgi:hypothetical protein